ncbi:MAG: hypothetical protein AAGF84_06015 [Planctomycetota bacterium]
MSKTWFDALEIQAEAQEQNPHVLRVGDARLLVAEHGARVLACELPGVDENLFFATDLTNEDGSAGMLTGGDRLWIAPEIAFFWPTLDDALRDPKGTAATPSEIDPAAWHNMNPDDEDRVELACGMALSDMRGGASGRLVVQREVIAERSGAADADGLTGVSFVVTNTIELQDDADAGFTAGAWDILQVPAGGTLVVPTTKAIDLAHDIRSYYVPFGDRHVYVDHERVRFRLDGIRRIKAGLRAEHTTGRMGYFRDLGDGRATMIVRVFAPQPGEPYCDVPITDPRNRKLNGGNAQGPLLGGDCFQTYSDDGDAFGGGPDVTFGEIEYHDPCVIGGEGSRKRTGTSITHVMAGPIDAVRVWGAEMLGCAIDPLE